MYTDDIMVLSKDSFPKHKYQIRVIFSGKLRVGLKMDTPEFSFLLSYISYLECAINQYGIKPDMSKVQVSWISDGLPLQLNHDHPLVWPSDTGTRVPEVLMCYPL